MAASVASINLRIWRLLVAVTVVTTLFVLRDIILPVSIAALITFLLSPGVNRLQPVLGRVGAVLLAAGATFSLLGLFIWITASQVVDLAWKLPTYQENLRSKLADIDVSDQTPLTGLSRMWENLDTTSNPTDANSDSAAPTPMPVRIASPGSTSRVASLRSSLQPFLAVLAPIGAVVILSLFMLMKREDLRDRIVGLIGRGNISKTTSAMGEASRRVNSYLRTQLIVNLAYGVPVAIGLWFIGVPNAMLWGVLAVVLRFIPYVGPIVAMVLPIGLSLAVFDTWTGPLLVIALFVTLELISNNIIEPWLYGSSTGISSFSLIVASLFWIWLWGVPGLVLSTPLTVCLLVMGRHVPHLAFLSTLLSNQGSLSSAETCYHRLIARDSFAFAELVALRLSKEGLEALIADTLLPALAMVESDYRSNLLDRETHEHVLSELRNTSDLPSVVAAASRESTADFESAEAPSLALSVACLPADSSADELAARLLALALSARGFQVQVYSSQLLTSELCSHLARQAPDHVWICAINPSTPGRVRIVYREIGEHLPDVRSAIALFHPGEELRKLWHNGDHPRFSDAFMSLDDVLLRTETFRIAAADHYLPAPIPEGEAERIKALLELNLGSRRDDNDRFTRVTSELTRVFEVPIALVSLIDADSQVFAGQCGLPADLAEAGRTPRSVSVCGHVAAGNKPFVIPDLLQDPRFAGNPLLKERQLRFYAGVPLRTQSGHAIGSLCILDHRPRTVTKREVRLLEMIAANLMCDLEADEHETIGA